MIAQITEAPYFIYKIKKEIFEMKFIGDIKVSKEDEEL